MSWTRLDDRFTDRTVFEDVDFESRWHYLALVQKCSAEGRWDGVMPLAKARRASDVTDPDKAHAALEECSLVEIIGNTLRVVEIADHIPPTHVRNNAQLSKIRMRRKRAHAAGDHSMCLPEHCPHAPSYAEVTRNTGTGQDRTGESQEQEELEPGDGVRNAFDDEAWLAGDGKRVTL